MSSYAVLRVGPVEVLRFTGTPGDELLAVFRDDMQTVMRLTGREFVVRYRITHSSRIGDDQELDVAEFRASWQAVAARLDLLGVAEADVRECLKARLSRPRAPGWEERAAELRGSGNRRRPWERVPRAEAAPRSWS